MQGVLVYRDGSRKLFNWGGEAKRIVPSETRDGRYVETTFTASDKDDGVTIEFHEGDTRDISHMLRMAEEKARLVAARELGCGRVGVFERGTYPGETAAEQSEREALWAEPTE